MANVKLGTKAVGSIVKIKVNGASKDFIVVQQGNPNTSIYDSSCNGTWLLMKDIYTTSTFGNNNSYKDSSIHTYLNGTFYNLIDSNIRAAIKQVKIPYQNGTGSGGSLATGSNGLSTKVFLLSGYEVGWTTSDNGYAEEKFGSGAGAEKKAHVIAVLRGYTPDWLDWAINERTLDWIVQIVFNFTKKKLEDYMEKKSAETTTVAHFGNVGENKRND